jgi:hypothetical protein
VAGGAVFAEKGPVRFIERGPRRGGLGDGGEKDEEEEEEWDKGMGTGESSIRQLFQIEISFHKVEQR